MCVHEKYMISRYVGSGYKVLLFLGGIVVFVIMFFTAFSVLKAVYEKLSNRGLKKLPVAFVIIFFLFYNILNKN